LLAPYLPVFYTGYVLDGIFLLFLLFGMLVIKVFLAPPRFVIYDNKQQHEDDEALQLDNARLKATKDSLPDLPDKS